MHHGYRIEGRALLGPVAGKTDHATEVSEMDGSFESFPEGWDSRTIVLMCHDRTAAGLPMRSKIIDARAGSLARGEHPNSPSGPCGRGLRGWQARQVTRTAFPTGYSLASILRTCLNARVRMHDPLVTETCERWRPAIFLGWWRCDQSCR